MRILADENISSRTVSALRALGLDVPAVSESHRGISDTVVLELCELQATVLITRDIELANRSQARQIEGVVLLRLRQMTDQEVAVQVANMFRKIELITGHFTILANSGVRHRVLLR